MPSVAYRCAREGDVLRRRSVARDMRGSRPEVGW